jgi:hypothetical protein
MPKEVAAGMPRRPGVGKFTADGEFVVTSFNEGDGLVPGTYGVGITCYEGLPDPKSADPFGEINFVPGDFKPADLVVAVDSDPLEINFDVPAKKSAQLPKN